MILISGYSGRCLAGQTRGKRFNLIELLEVRRMFDPHMSLPGGGGFVKFLFDKDDEIGRASCRERV